MIANLVAVLLAGTMPAVTQDRGSEAPAIKMTPEKKVCRIDQGTGTILSHRTCHTQAEWTAIDQADSERVARTRLSGQGNLRSAGGFGGN